LALLRLELELEGFRVIGVAGHGEEAVDLCAQLRPDILIVDFRMPPGPDGLAVLQRVRAQPGAPEVIVYSNYRYSNLPGRVRAGGGRYVPKGDLRMLRAALDGL
jgi:DNA-binding NarL/FixJ family response regulator